MPTGPGQRPGHLCQGVCPLEWVDDGAGEGLGTEVLAEGDPHDGQTDGNVGVALGEVVAVAGHDDAIAGWRAVTWAKVRG